MLNFQNFFDKYEQKYSFKFPIFLKRALELTGFADETGFKNLDASFLPAALDEISAQIIRFAASAINEPNDLNTAAYNHIQSKCYLSMKDYQLPIQFKSVITNMHNDIKISQQRSNYNQKPTSSKRMRQEDANLMLDDRGRSLIT